MTQNTRPASEIAAMEQCRGIYRDASSQMIARGVQPIDTALGCVFAAHDLAMHAGMEPAAAVEWIRTAADLMEQQLAAGQHISR